MLQREPGRPEDLEGARLYRLGAGFVGLGHLKATFGRPFLAAYLTMIGLQVSVLGDPALATLMVDVLHFPAATARYAKVKNIVALEADPASLLASWAEEAQATFGEVQSRQA